MALFLLGGTLLGLILYGAAHPASAFHDATRLAFRPLCHQLPERSFAIAGTPLCVCHRCFGIYAGLAAGGLLSVLGLRIDPGNRWLWFAAVVPMAVHVLTLNLWAGADLVVLRVGTGLLFGGLGGLALCSAFGAIGQRSKTHEPTPDMTSPASPFATREP
ncbi:MAG: DUF2085 domain-containing protein [Myxococcota bacterium]